ncbi:hypothetical protein A9Q84_16730 [Halobacteriovorax marinus]|uniref:Outer membrane protein beta-barrel domain-containing protein n=1 Tax=Halobacteriovorax marinus TaxID=97084 RepID=A0A1Y5F4H5_9BACT|nr:hypothetical protein A9Q84_16730 [Halobacteriovorax marinus]
MLRYFLALSLLVFSLSSSAGFFFEPYFGYASGDSDGILVDNGSGDTLNPGIAGRGEDEDLKFMDAGLRIGGYIQSIGLHIGANLSWMKGSANRSNTGKKKFQAFDLGPFIGWDIPILPFRVYGAALVSFKTVELNQTHTETDQNEVTLLTETGTDNKVAFVGIGTRLGVSVTLIPIITLNAEYRSVRYSSYQFGVIDNTLDGRIKEETVLLSMSIMFGEN